MKAAVLTEARNISYQTVPDPVLEPTNIIIKVKACGICGSDLHVYKGGTLKNAIMGHEFSGEVAKVGSQVSDIKTGERVIAAAYKPCGECYSCKHGAPHRCTSMLLGGFQIPGAMAEYTAIPFAQLNRNVFRISDKISYEEGAMIEPVSVGYGSIRRAQPKPEDTAVVIGAGVIGLGTIQVLKAMEVKKVIASGHRQKRLELAKLSGADVVIDATKQDTLSAVKEATSGLGPDVVFECAGTPETFNQSIQMVRGGGKVMIVGVYEAPLTWNPSVTIDKNLTIIGTLGGSFPKTLAFLEAGKLNTPPLITHKFPLSQAKEAFETQITARDAVKVMFKM